MEKAFEKNWVNVKSKKKGNVLKRQQLKKKGCPGEDRA